MKLALISTARKLAGVVALVALIGRADADVLAALAPADDARKAIAIGPGGEVYEPDGTGAWVRTKRIATASRIAIAGRAGDIVAAGGGVVYRLAPNGWSALRLAQDGAATMSAGSRAVGAVGRQLYSLDRLKGGEPEKLGVAPAPVQAIGSGKTIVVATTSGVHRIERGRATRIANAPGKLVDDRWALADKGAFDLRSGKTTPWPTGARVATASVLDETLAAVGTVAGSVELFTVTAAKLERAPITGASGTPVGVVLDRSGRAIVAFADGTLAIREGTSWTTTKVRDSLPAARPGPPPATSR